ncbi:hypothetical protein [Roseospira navarrensis]|uniref:Uncharacterized protein n=1 Tax=Roseospira navarrensis TaxID=140058 RepID=A0A7X1ZEC6_9PROT|nr:hypothetical protein [Roseospira navarrensis]MQX36747.1 hypothetical protein [Roseospira navarrensis]
MADETRDQDTQPDAETTATDKGRPPSAASRVLEALNGPKDAAKDPLEMMIAIFKDPDFSEEEKMLLYRLSSERFRNRRRMAYISLYMMVGATVFLGLLILIEGLGGGTGFSALIEKHTNILVWLGGFFTSIIAFYFGASTLRPSS